MRRRQRDELEAIPRALDNLFYTSYMLRVAYDEGEAEILTAILSCAYSYKVIAKTILERNPVAIDHSFYEDWVRGYADSHYCEANVLLLDMLNRLTMHYTAKQLQHLTEIFVACSKYEMEFWNMAWNMNG